MEHCLNLLEGLTLSWLIVYCLSTTVSLVWYLSLCSFAKKEYSRIGFFIVVVIMPFYIIIPFMALALCAAYLCPKKDFWTNYKYYNVAAVYGREQANKLFGERTIFTSKKLGDKLKRLDQ